MASVAAALTPNWPGVVAVIGYSRSRVKSQQSVTVTPGVVASAN